MSKTFYEIDESEGMLNVPASPETVEQEKVDDKLGAQATSVLI